MDQQQIQQKPSGETSQSVQPQTPKNLENLVENAQTVKRASVWGYFTFSLLLPPITLILALLFALRRGVLFVVLPSITIAYSVIALFWPILIYFLYGPTRLLAGQFAL